MFNPASWNEVVISLFVQFLPILRHEAAQQPAQMDEVKGVCPSPVLKLVSRRFGSVLRAVIYLCKIIHF